MIHYYWTVNLPPVREGLAYNYQLWLFNSDSHNGDNPSSPSLKQQVILFGWHDGKISDVTRTKDTVSECVVASVSNYVSGLKNMAASPAGYRGTYASTGVLAGIWSESQFLRGLWLPRVVWHLRYRCECTVCVQL